MKKKLHEVYVYGPEGGKKISKLPKGSELTKKNKIFLGIGLILLLIVILAYYF